MNHQEKPVNDKSDSYQKVKVQTGYVVRDEQYTQRYNSKDRTEDPVEFRSSHEEQQSILQADESLSRILAGKDNPDGFVIVEHDTKYPNKDSKF